MYGRCLLSFMNQLFLLSGIATWGSGACGKFTGASQLPIVSKVTSEKKTGQPKTNNEQKIHEQCKCCNITHARLRLLEFYLTIEPCPDFTDKRWWDSSKCRCATVLLNTNQLVLNAVNSIIVVLLLLHILFRC